MLSVDDHGFTIRAMQKLRANEHRFEFQNVKSVVYGQRLNGMQVLLDKLDRAGVPRATQHIAKDINAGRITVITNDGRHTVFKFFDKSFSDAEIRTFLETLHANDVMIKSRA